jgi:hypothetical protein
MNTTPHVDDDLAAQPEHRPGGDGSRPQAGVERCRGDAGMASSAVMVVVFTFTMIVIMSLTQYGLYWHAGQLANAAAEDGARRAAYRTGTLADGEATARATLAPATTGGLLTDLKVDVTSTGVDVTAVVEADVPQITPIPFPRRIRATSTGPKERFVTEGAPP